MSLREFECVSTNINELLSIGALEKTMADFLFVSDHHTILLSSGALHGVRLTPQNTYALLDKNCDRMAELNSIFDVFPAAVMDE